MSLVGAGLLFLIIITEDSNTNDLNTTLEKYPTGVLDNAFYTLLDVKPTSTKVEITKQYRKKALEYHKEFDFQEDAERMFLFLLIQIQMHSKNLM